MVHQLTEYEDFSDVKRTMNALKDILFHTPLTDETKIAFIKEELSTGRYQVQSASLAAKLMEHLHQTQQEEMEEII
jgi:anti-sigma28 factor (negative regulator of flagellin synthesis)